MIHTRRTRRATHGVLITCVIIQAARRPVLAMLGIGFCWAAWALTDAVLVADGAAPATPAAYWVLVAGIVVLAFDAAFRAYLRLPVSLPGDSNAEGSA